MHMGRAADIRWAFTSNNHVQTRPTSRDTPCIQRNIHTYYVHRGGSAQSLCPSMEINDTAKLLARKSVKISFTGR